MSLDEHSRSCFARFSASAAVCERAGIVQHQVARRLLAFLPPPEGLRRVIEIGCGTGVLTRWLADAYPGAEIVAIDAAHGRIAIARRRLHAYPRVRTEPADVMAYEPAGAFDLIVSSSTLHWILDQNGLFRRLAGWLNPAGRTVFSVMLDRTLEELRASRARVAPRKPATVSLPAWETVRAAAEGAGFRVARHEEETFRVPYASATDFLSSLHEGGLTGGRFSRAGMPLSRGELSRLVADYAEHYHSDSGRVYATYRVAYAELVFPPAAAMASR